MTRRIGTAAVLALLGGAAWLIVVTAVRVVDWIVGGSLLGWAALLGGMALIFLVIVVTDLITDGKVTRE